MTVAVSLKAARVELTVEPPKAVPAVSSASATEPRAMPAATGFLSVTVAVRVVRVSAPPLDRRRKVSTSSPAAPAPAMKTAYGDESASTTWPHWLTCHTTRSTSVTG